MGVACFGTDVAYFGMGFTCFRMVIAFFEMGVAYFGMGVVWLSFLHPNFAPGFNLFLIREHGAYIIVSEKSVTKKL